MESKPRLSRLTEIITQLQAKKIVTATYLAEKHGVSVRTIYRDIRSLEESGIPIITEEGKGYSIMEGYHLPPVLFSEKEANALITAEQLIIKNKDQSLSETYSSAIEKIKAILKQTQKGKAEMLAERVFFGENRKEEKSSNNLMTIQLAITNFQVIEIEYVSVQQKASKRKIEPFAFYNNKGNWLLVAFCQMRNEFRAFRIDLIEKLIVQNDNFEPHNMTIQEYFERYVKK